MAVCLRCGSYFAVLADPSKPVAPNIDDGQVSQISSFGQDASGELYIASLAGSVFKIVPR